MNLDGNQASIREACDNGLLAGAVTLIWQAGTVLQVNEIGYRDVEAGLPMQRDTVFRIASMTKPITVAAAMTLVEEGKLALSDRVSRWLPELADMQVLTDPHGPLDKTVPAMRQITIEDLMTHRSGLAYTFSVTGPIARAYNAVSLRQDADHWLADVAQLPLVHQPGERLTYSHSTEVLGIVLSRIEGKPLQEVLTERVFGPLGMTDTGFYVSPQARRRAATMYQLDADNRLSHDVMGPAPIAPPRFSQGGGGLWSTADDYLAFVRMLLGGGEVDGVRVLSEDSVRAMRTDQLTEAQKRMSVPGHAVLAGPRLRAEPVGGHRPGAVHPAVRSGRCRDVHLAGRVRHLVAGRPDRRPDPDLPDSERPGSVRRSRGGGRREHLAGETAHGTTEVRAADLSGAGVVAHLRG